MEANISSDHLDGLFNELRIKLENLDLLVRDYPSLQKSYEEGDFGSLKGKVDELYVSFHNIKSTSEANMSDLIELSSSLQNINDKLENSDIVRQAGVEYLKEFELYQEEGKENSSEYLNEIELVRQKQESKIKILKDEIQKLVQGNEELEIEVEKLKDETSEEQKEYEFKKQKKEINDLQKEIQNMEIKIQEGQEELENLRYLK